jgi:hypothetical protein
MGLISSSSSSERIESCGRSSWQRHAIGRAVGQGRQVCMLYTAEAGSSDSNPKRGLMSVRHTQAVRRNMGIGASSRQVL